MTNKISANIDLNKIYHMKCEDGLPLIPDESVQLILCDLPYEETRNIWDNSISLDFLWEQYHRIIKPNGAIILTASEKFSVDLYLSNKKMYKYKYIWVKSVASNQLNCNFAPLKAFEEILVFSKASAAYVKNKDKGMKYNPQFTEGEPYKIKRKARDASGGYDKQSESENINNGYRYPTNVLYFSNPRIRNGHPTQKPVDLFKWLIKTYTDEGDTVLDHCVGSGTTPIAAIETNRNYIGMDNEIKYIDMANERIEKALMLR